MKIEKQTYSTSEVLLQGDLHICKLIILVTLACNLCCPIILVEMKTSVKLRQIFFSYIAKIFVIKVVDVLCQQNSA